MKQLLRKLLKRLTSQVEIAVLEIQTITEINETDWELMLFKDNNCPLPYRVIIWKNIDMKEIHIYDANNELLVHSIERCVA